MLERKQQVPSSSSGRSSSSPTRTSSRPRRRRCTGSGGVPGGALVERVLVRPLLVEIFDYRRARIAELLGA